MRLSYAEKENYVHDTWDLERRKGHIYNVIFAEHYGILAGKHVLQVGCNTGSTLELVREEWGPASVRGIEINDDAAKIAREQRGLDVRTWNVLSAARPSPIADTVLLLDVVEHIYPEDMQQFIGNVWRCLNDRGKVLLTIPRHPTEVSNDPHHVQFFEKPSEVIAPWLELFTPLHCYNETRANLNDGKHHDMWVALLEEK